MNDKEKENNQEEENRKKAECDRLLAEIKVFQVEQEKKFEIFRRDDMIARRATRSGPDPALREINRMLKEMVDSGIWANQWRGDAHKLKQDLLREIAIDIVADDTISAYEKTATLYHAMQKVLLK